MDGVCRRLTAELPNLPTLAGLSQTGLLSGQPGILNAETLNQLLMLCFAGYRGAPAIRSGRPPRVFVLDGSNSSKEGVNHCPVCSVITVDKRQPPRKPSARAGMWRPKRWLRPTGRL